MSMFKKLKSVFVVEEEGKPPKSPAPKNKTTSAAKQNLNPVPRQSQARALPNQKTSS